MPGTTSTWNDIDPFVAELERRFAEEQTARVADILPLRTHPHYTNILTELLRVDLEMCWNRGIQRTVADYITEFPEVRDSHTLIEQLAFEEYRARRQNGLDPSPDSFRLCYRIDTSAWPTGTESHPLHARSGTMDDRAQVTVKVPTVASAEPPGQIDSELNGPTSQRLGEALSLLEKDLTTFQGYQLIRELGRGAFARVYLARQPDLAGRLVVLKIAADLRGEPQTLSQLQHANIVPIYAVHDAGPVQAFLMPYFGSTTFADLLRALRQETRLPNSGEWIVNRLRSRSHEKDVVNARTDHAISKLSRLSFHDAMLVLLTKLAQGLACAHERGILHLDLKPANLLLADDGEPMLLDFNLATDPQVRSRVSTAYVGGTLPYMSPERLRAFQCGQRHETPQDDIYSFGLIAMELLTAHPQIHLKRLSVDDVIQTLLALRSKSPKPIRTVAPGLAAIVAKCVDIDPAKRYTNASELAIDLQHQLHDEPLYYAPNPSLIERVRKWGRRHPRLASGYSLGVVAASMLFCFGSLMIWMNRRFETTRQRTNLLEFRTEYESARLTLSGPASDPHETEQALSLAKTAVLARFPITESSTIEPNAISRLNFDEKLELQSQLFELYLVASRGQRIVGYQQPTRRDMAWAEAERLNRLADKIAINHEGHQLVSLQRSTLTSPRQAIDASSFLSHVETIESPRRLRAAAGEAIANKRFTAAAKLLAKATVRDPADPVGWYLLGCVHEYLKQPQEAQVCYAALVALRPKSAVAHYRLAATYAELKRWSRSIEYYDRAVELDADYYPAMLDRGLAKLALNDLVGAEADLSQAIAFEHTPTRAYFIRASIRMKRGDTTGAKADRTEGLSRSPSDEVSWISRGVQKLATSPKDAIADFDAALNINPQSVTALQNKAHALAELLGQTQEAINTLDNALQIEPDHTLVRIGRAVLLARLGDRTRAIADTRIALKQSQEPVILYQAACVYALTSQQTPADRGEAIRLLTVATRAGYGQQMLRTDADLKLIQNDPEFLKLIQK